MESEIPISDYEEEYLDEDEVLVFGEGLPYQFDPQYTEEVLMRMRITQRALSVSTQYKLG